MSLTAGATVGRYQIHSLLGSGGMGEVYRASDPMLGRQVALKVLRRELGADPERLTRFLQEARAASALNHPNILTIHEVGDHESSRFIISEFVEGETVRQRLERGPLTLREILDIAIQTASALAAAHAASIVHRDIKPDNLMLRPDGYVKVLDFGVATFTRNAAAPTDATATIAPETGAGMIVGTIAYMSPEQARGRSVDGRSDCYSLGIVLYELVTGRAPFTAPTSSDLLVAILEREPPPLRQAARSVPAQLEWIIEKALEKDPNLRYQTIADMRVDLLRLKTALESGRLTQTAAPVEGVGLGVDLPVERHLTDDSPEVVALSRVSWATAALAVVAVAALVTAMSYYHLVRPGADLPLHVPEGAVLTKARDAIESLGYSGWGSRSKVEFSSGLNVRDVTAMAGLPAAREAIRDGAVAYWSAGLTHSRDPDDEPVQGDFKVNLDPRGQLIGFTTGASPDPATAADRDRGAALGFEALKKAFGIDASGYEFEYIQRAFPAGAVEMTWRNPAPRYGHVEQFRVHLRGERVVRIDRSFEKPPGYTEPERPMVARGLEFAGVSVVLPAALGAWAFGLFVLFKTRNWDALTDRLPLVVCGILILQMGLDSMGDAGALQGLLGAVAVAILLGGTLLPALSGVVFWMRRQSPERMWATDQLMRGRVFGRAVSAAVVDGVIAGAAITGLEVLGDFIGIRIDGFMPSISREVDAVDQGLGTMLGDGFAYSSFLAIGLGFGVEVLDRLFARFRVPRIVTTLIVAFVFGAVLANGQRVLLPAVPLALAGAAFGIIGVELYRRRGLLALFVAGLVMGLLTHAMSARVLEDPGLVYSSNVVFGLVALIGAIGAWGVIAGRRAGAAGGIAQ
jgi:hypothetical protein